MNKMQLQVEAFHNEFGVTVGGTPAIRDADLREKLIAEEADEVCAALRHRNFEGVIDGLCDLIYVALGTAVACGVDLEPFFDEVHRSNMAKFGGPIRDDGKILKPEGWEPPRIAELLRALFDAGKIDVVGGLRLREGDQPLPARNASRDIQSMVINDVTARREVGIKRYGTVLQAHNGRNALRDAYEEALDLACYLKQALVEREGEGS